MRIAVLMPTFDEAGRLASTLRDLDRIAADADVAITVFVVDDGGAVPVDAEDLRRAAGASAVVLARHPVNLGQGAALETARRLAVEASERSRFDAYVTMDADGQHRAEDALALARAIGEGADVALGDRFGGRSAMPRSRRVLLSLARLFERIATGVRLSDAHNGLRAFGPKAIGAMRLRQNRMAHATEITRRIAYLTGDPASLRVVEVPVTIRYTEESMAKGQSATGAIAIVVDLLHGYLFGD